MYEDDFQKSFVPNHWYGGESGCSSGKAPQGVEGENICWWGGKPGERGADFYLNESRFEYIQSWINLNKQAQVREELAAQSEKVKRIREELAEEMLKLAEAEEALDDVEAFNPPPA